MKQDRFLLSGVKEGEEPWQIPLHIVDGENVLKETFGEKEASYDVKSVKKFSFVFVSVIIIVGCPQLTSLKKDTVRLNPTYFGFYRIAYDASLLSSIQKNVSSFSTLDRLGFVSDCFAVTKGLERLRGG